MQWLLSLKKQHFHVSVVVAFTYSLNVFFALSFSNWRIKKRKRLLLLHDLFEIGGEL